MGEISQMRQALLDAQEYMARRGEAGGAAVRRVRLLQAAADAAGGGAVELQPAERGADSLSQG